MKLIFNALMLTAIGLSVVSTGVRASKPTKPLFAVGDEGLGFGLATLKGLREENSEP